MGISFKYFFFTTLILIFLFFPAKVNSQQSDTLTVEWADTAGSVIINALYTTIKYDTLKPPGRVYRLKKGGYYWNTETIYSNGALEIIGEESSPNNPNNNPPVIQIIKKNDGVPVFNKGIFTLDTSLILKNVYIIGSDDFGNQSQYRQVFANAKNSRFVFDDVIFDRSNYSPVYIVGTENDISITNCKFRNIIVTPGSSLQGNGIFITGDQDTVIIENNTFFNIEYSTLNVFGGAISYLRFNHNTILNIGHEIASGNNWWRTAYFGNNLIVNGFWQGQNRAAFSLSHPKYFYKGMFAISPLPSKYGPEEGRRILYLHTASWRDPAFINYYADSIRAQPFIGIDSINLIEKYEQMFAVDTTWLADKPAFPVYPSELLDDMIQNITELRAGSENPHTYFYQLPKNPDSSYCYTCVSWPLPENFSYSDAHLLTAGIDGLPLGDLNWFPQKKENWETHKEQYIRLFDSFKCRDCFPVPIWQMEAEDGILSGDAVVKKFEGFSYFQIDEHGFFEWEFDILSAGQYDLNILTNMRGYKIRGQHTYVNGKDIHDNAHKFGELIYDQNLGVTEGMPIDEWTWVRWKQNDIVESDAFIFPAGKNKIKIESSWGYQNFAGIDLHPTGAITPIIQLKAPDATSFDLVQARGEGVWVPSRLKYVSMGNNGRIDWDTLIIYNGRFAIQISYQNYGAPVTGEIYADGILVSHINFSSSRDSNGIITLSDQFSLVQGHHRITLAAGNVNVDFIRLTGILTGEYKDPGTPATYSLAQNYPNPFNPSTTICYSIPERSEVSLIIYDVLGREVTTLISGEMEAGEHAIQWNAGNAASGVYFYRLQAGNFTSVKKLILLR